MILEGFLFRALAGGIGLALVAGPLGCFVVWRRMAYFGDALAHSALLGVALGFLFGIDLRLGVLASCLALALLLAALQSQHRYAADTLLGILAHTALSLGVIAVSLLRNLRVDLVGYLFGDILALGPADLAWIGGGGAAVLVLLIRMWRPLLALTVHEELALAEGVPAWPVRIGFMALIAVAVALAMKVVGILLITSLLIIPPAAARPFARTPERMALLAAVAGAASVVCGLAASFRWDLPAGPAVVAAAAGVFAVSFLAGAWTKRPEG